MLDRDRFVVRERAKRFLAPRASEVLDGDTGQLLGTATPAASAVWAVLGLVLARARVPMAIEVREKPDDSLVFTVVRRVGVFSRPVEAVDSQGQLLGTYRTERFGRARGFTVADAHGHAVCDVRGQLLGAGYAFVTPDGKAELGRVTRTWAGRTKALLTGAGTYAVEIDPDFTDQPITKMLLLGAALAVHGLFTPAGRSTGG